MSPDLSLVFVRLFDALQKVPVVHLRDWAKEDRHQTRAIAVARDAAGGSVTLPTAATDAHDAFSVAIGLHDALRRADPTLDAAPPPALLGYRDRLAATNNLLPSLEYGALVPCHVQPRRPQAGPTVFADFFPSLRRIDQETFRGLGWVRLPPHRDLSPGRLIVASVPFLAERSDIQFTAHRDGTYYTAEPDGAALVKHVPTALAELDASGAQLALLPEAAADEALLKAWQAACRDVDPTGSLRFLMVGTGSMAVSVAGCLLAGEISDDELGFLPHNRAVILDRETGEIVLGQDKQRGFSMDAQYRKREKLVLNEASVDDITTTVDELMTDSPGLNILDSRSRRLAVLICEDLGRVTVTGATVFRAGVDLVLAPVLAPPVMPGKWQQQAAQQLTPDGVDVVVVNSLALGREDLDPTKGYSRTGGPAATLVAITEGSPTRRPGVHDPLPGDARTDALTARVVTLD